MRTGTVILAISFMVFLVTILNAINVEMKEPIVKSISDGETVELGTIGPGQTLALTVKGTEIGKGGLQANWGVLGVLEVPTGWQGFDSDVYAKNMKATIKADSNAPDGIYLVKLILTECEDKFAECSFQQGLGKITFYGKIRISRDVMNTNIKQVDMTTGIGQPARYPIKIENKGAANDIFEISVEGIPEWNFIKRVYVAAGETLNTFYEIVPNEEKEYKPTITIKSISSDRLMQKYDVRLVSKSNVIGDIKATKNGVLIFPTTLEPLYSLMGILGYLIQ